jgi:SAM-dependent methyltransferase
VRTKPPRQKLSLTALIVAACAGSPHNPIPNRTPRSQGMERSRCRVRRWDLRDRSSRRGAIVTGLDCSCPMLVAARQREQQSLSKAGILWCHGQVEALLLQDASFDLVLAITVLCLVPSPNRVIGELTRVLRPGCHFCSCSAASISNCTLDEGHRWFYGFLSPTQLVTEYLRHA